VFLRFLGDRPQDADTPHCVEFCRLMCEQGRPLFVAALTLAEVSRHRGLPVPRTKGITVVPFDDRAAHILGLEMPMAKLHTTSQASGLTLTYLKYDAMITACALRCRTKNLVTLDSDHSVMAHQLGLEVRHPSHYASPQTELLFVRPN
jgi:hypothetical protein